MSEPKEEKSTRGKQFNQKMKPYLVYDYLMRHSDVNHVVTAAEIVGYLQECGIEAERRSIYKDIEAITPSQVPKPLKRQKNSCRMIKKKPSSMMNTAKDSTSANGITRWMMFVFSQSVSMRQNSLRRNAPKGL